MSDIADVLDKHGWGWSERTHVVYCIGCGWSRNRAHDPTDIQEFHRAHVADVLEPLIRAREKAAWDEGYQAAYGMARGYGHTDHWDEDAEPANPYEGATDV